MKKHVRFLAAMMLAAVALMSLSGQAAMADTRLLPAVTEEMTAPSYWTAGREMKPLAEKAQLEEINHACTSRDACYMIDLTREYSPYNGADIQRELLQAAVRDMAEYLKKGYFVRDGRAVPYSAAEEIFRNISEAETQEIQTVSYGICVEAADVRAVPSDLLVTDEKGDTDYDALQLSALRVNEPVVVKARSADGAWYYCDTSCVSGWTQADRIAICKDREEWLDAWQFPDEETVVVMEAKLYLDQSNANSATSQRMLTMGTILRKVGEAEYDAAVTNRAIYHNYAVWLPVRDESGAYARTIALIPEHRMISEGYPELTEENILKVAFSALGDAYGWGGMLGVPDCSLYVRNVYKCFGLEIPRNTTWQSAMPAWNRDLADMAAADKAALLDTLPAGTILIFRGHEMLYLGASGGKHYVLSSVGSIMNPDGSGVLRIRSVTINSLEDTLRGNGNTWLEDLNKAVIPYLPEEAAEEAADAA